MKNIMQIADQFSFKRGSKVFKGLLCTFTAATLIVSGFFIASSVLADAIVIPTSNGMNISIDTTSAGGSGVFTSLNIEINTGNLFLIHTGKIILIVLTKPEPNLGLISLELEDAATKLNEIFA